MPIEFLLFSAQFDAVTSLEYGEAVKRQLEQLGVERAHHVVYEHGSHVVAFGPPSRDSVHATVTAAAFYDDGRTEFVPNLETSEYVR